MIDFSKIEQPNSVYEALYPLVRWGHDRIYYRDMHVEGRQNLPSEGTPYMMLSNHQNGLNDAMLMLTSQNDPTRRPVFIARADIFNNPLIGLLMRWLRILPAYRVQDTGREHVGDNNIIFARAADILTHGGVIGMFPEALAHRNPELRPLKKGFARIAFDAAQKRSDLLLIPTANWYSEYEHPGSHAGIWYGKPVSIADLLPLYETQPAHAYMQLCERMHTAISQVCQQRDQWVEQHREQLNKKPSCQWIRQIVGFVGLLPNILPVAIIESIATWVVKNPILKGSVRIALGIFLLMPILWMLQAVIIAVLTTWWGGLLAMAAQVVGIIAWTKR